MLSALIGACFVIITVPILLFLFVIFGKLVYIYISINKQHVTTGNPDLDSRWINFCHYFFFSFFL